MNQWSLIRLLCFCTLLVELAVITSSTTYWAIRVFFVFFVIPSFKAALATCIFSSFFSPLQNLHTRIINNVNLFREHFSSETQWLLFNIFDKYWIFTHTLNEHIYLLASKYILVPGLTSNIFLTKILANAPLTLKHLNPHWSMQQIRRVLYNMHSQSNSHIFNDKVRENWHNSMYNSGTCTKQSRKF